MQEIQAGVLSAKDFRFQASTRNGFTSPSALRQWIKSIERWAALYILKTIDWPEPSPAMIFGSVLHILILQPELEKQCIRVPPIEFKAWALESGLEWNRTKKEGKASFERYAEEIQKPFEASCKSDSKEDIFVISVEELAKARRMAERVFEHPLAGSLIQSAGMVELPIWCEHQELVSGEKSGIKLKTKVDKALYSGVMFDLKSTNELSIEQVKRAVGEYDYHYETALQLTTRDAVIDAGQWPSSNGIDPGALKGAAFNHIFVSKEEPHECALVLIDPEDLQWARADAEQYLVEYAKFFKQALPYLREYKPEEKYPVELRSIYRSRYRHTPMQVSLPPWRKRR